MALYAVNPVYSSIWGGQHWQSPFKDVTRHQAAATVLGRRVRARRRKGVTCQRPEGRGVRATNQGPPKTSELSVTVNGQGTGNRIQRAQPLAQTIIRPSPRYPGNGQQRQYGSNGLCV